MSTFGSLNIAVTGMAAHRRILDLTAHNVANATTAGYHRQRAELQSLGGRVAAGISAGSSTRTYGVDVIDVTRSIDELLAARATREDAGRSMANLTSATMSRVEGIFPEPTDLGLAHQLDEYWSAWTDLANNPGDLAARTQLLESADTLVTALHRGATDLNGVRESAVTRMNTLAAEVNDLATQIARLNPAINSNPDNIDLLDQRDLLVASLSRLTGAVARPTTNGQVDVSINGRTLVSAAFSYPVDGTTGILVWVADGQAVTPPSGDAASLAATIGDVVPRYLASLDDVASTLVSSVNAVHSAGFDQSGTTGRTFFDATGVTAATIALSVDVAGLPANIAAGAPVLPGPTAPGPLDGEHARAIAALADSATGADTKYQALVTTLAIETRAAAQRSNIQEHVADSAIRDADSVGSVSIDEEMATLVAAQRAYEASARVFTAIDAMLGVLLERTGVVGR
ncbi:MAG: flagellar hook-associated protein FlgK [Actinomycetota bacterium]